MPSDILVALVGSLQASVSVLLTIFYGTIAAQYRLLDETSSAKISSLCIKFLLPALLVTNVGSEVQLDTAHRYIPVLGKTVCIQRLIFANAVYQSGQSSIMWFLWVWGSLRHAG